VAPPALAQIPRPIAGAEDWLLLDRIPGVSGEVCSARTNGPEADTMLLLNRNHVPILAAGRADWQGLLGTAEIQLSIDGAAPSRLKVQMFNNLVMILVSDAPLLQRLRRARTLDWTLPFGHFRASVTGLGAALDAVASCSKANPAIPQPG
jgi:hypothetical protein